MVWFLVFSWFELKRSPASVVSTSSRRQLQFTLSVRWIVKKLHCIFCLYRIYPKYWGTLTSYLICNVSWETVPSDVRPTTSQINLRIRTVVVSMKKYCILSYPKMRRGKILIRLCECAGWSECSLGAHIRRYVVWRCDTLIKFKQPRLCV